MAPIWSETVHGICSRILSVQISNQFAESVARGKLRALILT